MHETELETEVEPEPQLELAAPPAVELETETLVLPTLAPAEPTGEMEVVEAELVEPEALPDLPEPEPVAAAEPEPEPLAEVEQMGELEAPPAPSLPLARD